MKTLISEDLAALGIGLEKWAPVVADSAYLCLPRWQLRWCPSAYAEVAAASYRAARLTWFLVQSAN